MTIRSGWLTLMVAVAGCGVPDASAVVGGPGYAPEEEVGTSADALSNSAGTWLPMQDGNQWVLKSTSGSSSRTFAFDSVSGGVGFFSGLHGDGQWLGTSSSAVNSLYAYNEGTSSWSAFMRFGYAVSSWSFSYSDSPCEKFTVKRSATDVTVTTPAGTFANARTISLTQVGAPNVRCAAPELKELTFAPDVGVVALVTGAGERFTLKSAKVGGKAYPASPGGGALKTVLKADRTTYTNTPNTIRCITVPCPSNEVTAKAAFTYTIVNATSQSQTWQFSSGCQFDIELRDVSGSVVRRLSDGRFCTQSLTSLTLAPGASKVFSAELELKDSDGLQLDGSFTAKALLKPRLTAPDAAATAEFGVRIVN